MSGERNAVKREMNRGLQETKWYARPCEDQGGGVDMSMLGDDVYEDVEGTSERDSEYFRYKAKGDCDVLLTSHARAWCQGDVQWLIVSTKKFSTRVGGLMSTRPCLNCCGSVT